MEPKKSPKADIDSRSLTYFLGGAAVAILIVIVAFSLKKYERNATMLTSDLEIPEEEEIADITKQEEKPPPPPPPPELEVVEDEVEVEDNTDAFEQTEDIEEAIELPPVDDEEEAAPAEEIFLVVEDQPEFPGGNGEMMKWIAKNIKYPPMERDAGIEGLVVVNFVVDKDGSINDPNVVKSVSDNIDREALRVVKAMPKWKPGKQRGQAVKVRMNLPIRFSLR